jgi:hypothetical protein
VATKSRGRSSARVVEEEPGRSTTKLTEAKHRVAKGTSKAKTSMNRKKGKNQVYFKIQDLAHIACNRFCSGNASSLIIPRLQSDSDTTDRGRGLDTVDAGPNPILGGPTVRNPKGLRGSSTICGKSAMGQGCTGDSGPRA